MKLCHISPSNALNKISILGNIEFCLTPYCKDEKYLDYFIEEKKKGRFVIVDNGIAENKLIKLDKMIEYAFKIKASEFIIPDVIGDKKKSDNMRKDFLNKYYKIFKDKGIRLMGVIQGSTFEEYLKSFEEINNDKRIDVIGIPFRMKFYKFDSVNKDILHSLNRLTFLHFIKNKVIKDIHCLGCNSIAELIELNKIKQVRSCDSKIICRYSMIFRSISPSDISKPVDRVDIEKGICKQGISFAKTQIKRLNTLLK